MEYYRNSFDSERASNLGRLVFQTFDDFFIFSLYNKTNLTEFSDNIELTSKRSAVPYQGANIIYKLSMFLENTVNFL